MSNLHSILPLLAKDSWEWGKDELVNERIPAGRSESLFSSSGIPGFLYYGLVVVRGPEGQKTEVEIDLDSFQLKSTIEEAYRIGSTDAGVVSPGIARYDTENNLYSIVYKPNPPLGYISNAKISVTAPSQSDIRIDSDALRLNIIDRERFAASYQEVTISTLLDEFTRVGGELNETNNRLEELIELIEERQMEII